MLQRRLILLEALSCVLIATIAACGGKKTAGDGGTPTCETVPDSHASTLRHVTASGTEAAAVWTALNALLSAQTTPVATASSYSFSSLDCADIEPGTNATPGYQCELTLQGAPDGGSPIEAAAPSSLAQNLLGSLISAGGNACDNGSAGPEIAVALSLVNVDISATSVSFDDVSQEALPPSANAVVSGTEASQIIAAIDEADVDDCDASQSAAFTCSKSSTTAAPTCGVLWNAIDATTGLVQLCDVSGTDGGAALTIEADGGLQEPAALTAAQSQALWTAITTAATSIGFQPANGTVAEATVLNASFFYRQGETLTFLLTMDDASPPPAPGG